MTVYDDAETVPELNKARIATGAKMPRPLRRNFPINDIFAPLMSLIFYLTYKTFDRAVSISP